MLDLTHRPRRLRSTDKMRQLVRETRLDVRQLIYPLFVSEKISDRIEIQSMPGVAQLSLSSLKEECQSIAQLGIPAVLLFGIPEQKDDSASQAYADNGIVQRAVRAIKQVTPDLVVITDVCLCEYTSHGHCGVVAREGNHYSVLNDASVELLVKTAISHASVGADIVAPSDMMDGRVGAIRTALDGHGHTNVAIMSYASKFCSAFYGPFREAAESAPQFGDRRTYQMDGANLREAMREIDQDIAEGADMLLMKPAMPYLDVILAARERYDLPMGAYQVSGEYSMLHAAFERGWLERERAMMESLLSIRRAGADFIVTYFAKDAAKVLG